MIDDVQASVWINASAGSGKTKKLVDRIVALLRAQVDPEKILCITYTKSAASEMAERLKSAVEQFEDQQLYEDLFRKRKTGQWVRIETIHSFAFSILQQYSLMPMEQSMDTDLTAKMQICDDIERSVLCKRVIRKLLHQQECERHLREISYFANNLYDVLIPNVSRIQGFFAHYHVTDVEDVAKFFGNVFSCEIYEFEHVMKEFHTRVFSMYEDLSALAEYMLQGNETDREKSNLLQNCLANRDMRLLDLFYTQNGDLRKRIISASLGKIASCTALLEKIVCTIDQALQWRNVHMSASMNTHVFSIAYYFVEEYQREKNIHAHMDFGDIIAYMITALQNRTDVRYKIDRNLEHVLLDEAQDTSPEQWELIDMLVEEFWAHECTGHCRTIFVVGDHKQSIYSFQGADAKIFEQQRLKYKQKILQSGGKFYEMDSATSYRSVPQVLEFVDQLQLFENVTHHNYRQQTGCVEKCPIFEDENSKISAIAEDIVHKLQRKCYVPSRGRPARPEDFMILFQRRNLSQMKNLTRILRDHGVKVSGMDTIDLKDEMLVEDMLAMLEWLADPQSDIALAQLLRTPLMRISNEQLHAYACERQQTLLEELHSRAETGDESAAQLLKVLSTWRQYASKNSVYNIVLKIWSFVENIYLHIIGEFAKEIMHAFLDVIWQYQSKYASNVYQFLQWFAERSFTYKRSLHNTDGVVFMTVHASKGLQAPFVYLADCEFYNTTHERMLNYQHYMLWDFSKHFRTPLIKQLKDVQKYADDEENKRLLYVALTRAEDFLYMAAHKQKTNSFAELLSMNEDKDVRGSHIYTAEESVCEGLSMAKSQADVAAAEESVFVLQIRDLCTEECANVSEEENVEESAVVSAQRRGEAMHKLLDILPRVDCDARFTQCLLRPYGMDASHEAAQTAINVIKEFMNAEDGQSYNELELIVPETLRDGIRSSTIRLDKLIHHNTQSMSIIEYKSGKICDAAVQKYRQQLSFYRDVVSHCFDIERSYISTYILWLDEHRLMRVE